jgi:hypothetical protein
LGAETYGRLTASPAPELLGKAIGFITATLVGTVFFYQWNLRLGRYYFPLPTDPAAVEERPVRLEIVRDGGRSVDFVDIGLTPSQAKAIVSQGYALKFNYYPSTLIPHSALEGLRAELIKMGLAYAGPRGTVVLNAEGKRALLETAYHPSPTRGYTG